MLSINNGHFGLANTLFIVALVLFVLGAILVARPYNDRPFYALLIAAGLACMSLALYVS